MPRLAEEEDEAGGVKDDKQSPPSLPPPPLFLSPEQTKRRHIISSLVVSENNYLASLTRLVTDYKLPLEESNPPILSQAKVDILFHKLDNILSCHQQFRVALTEAILVWDQVSCDCIIISSHKLDNILKLDNKILRILFQSNSTEDIC